MYLGKVGNTGRLLSDSNCLLGVRLRKDQTLLLRIHLNYYVAYKTSTSTQKEGCNKKGLFFEIAPYLHLHSQGNHDDVVSRSWHYYVDGTVVKVPFQQGECPIYGFISIVCVKNRSEAASDSVVSNF